MFSTFPRRRGLRAVTALTAVAAAGLALAPAAFATSASGDWLAGQLVATGPARNTAEHFVTSYTFGGQTYSYDDTGLTIDGYLALEADDAAGHATHLSRTSNWVRQNKTSYYSDGSGTASCTGHTASGELYSAALAKTAFQVLASGGGAAPLLKTLACLQGTVEAGRFSDSSAYGDYSNPFGQAFAILDFVKSPIGQVAARGVTYLRSQQCTTGADAGSFASYFGAGCSAPSVDATAMAAMALQAFADHSTGAASTNAAAAAAGAAAWIAGQHQNAGTSQAYWTSTACGAAAASVNTTSLAVLGLDVVQGASAPLVTRGQAWLSDPAQSPASGEMPGCTDPNAAVQASNDVRATTQGVLGKALVTYPDLLGV